MYSDKLNRITPLETEFSFDSKEMNQKELPREKLQFINKYNNWLGGLKEGDKVTVRQGFLGGVHKELGTIQRVTSNRFLVVVTHPTGLRTMYELFRLRPVSEGFPKRTEVLLEPAIVPQPEMEIVRDIGKILED